MKKMKWLFIILLSFTFLIVKTSVYANEEALPNPVHTVTGNLVSKTEEREIYDSVIEIQLGFSSSVSGVSIQYQLFKGTPPTNWTAYTKPLRIDRQGNYRLRYRSSTAGNKFGVEQAINITVDIPVVETYPNVVRNDQVVDHKDTGQPIELPIYAEKSSEIRAVWVSTVSNIDLPRHTDDASYKNEIIKILNRVQSLNMNTVFFQVRSMNDAFYPSELAPYSRYIKGAQGTGLDWDILRFTIDEAHKRGLELHAWMNPYRIANMDGATTKEEMLATLHEDNFAKKHPEYVLKQTNAPAGTTGSFILDPGIPAVRQYLYDVIDELLTNYPDVDGIHFDDYFYVTTDQDTQTFNNHNPENIGSLADWRRNNVNLLVQGVNNLVKDFNARENKKVKFGISPSGVWANKGSHPNGSNTTGWQSYSALYADTRRWVKEEWLDYLVPQLYWDFDNASAPFAVLVDWWADVARGTNVDLLIGLGFYRYNDGKNSWENEDVFVEQLRYISQYEEIKGHATFTYNTFTGAQPQVTSTIERLGNYYWTNPVDFTWDSDVEVIPFDDAEMIALRESFRDVIQSVNRYINLNNITLDENLDFEDKKLGEYFASKETFELIEAALINAGNVVDNRFKKQIIMDAKTELELAFIDFKDNVYEGGFDPNRQAAVDILQAAIDQVLVRRNLILDSLGKPASELPKDKYYAPTDVLANIDAVLLEARNIILDETSISMEINEVYHRLKSQEEILNNSYFKGELEEGKIIVYFKNGEEIVSVEIDKGQTVQKPENPVKEGFIFEGWYLEDLLFDFETEINESLTLIASFKEVSDDVVEELEFLLEEFEERLASIKASSKTDPKKLRKNHKFIDSGLMAELKALIAEVKELIENEEATNEEIMLKIDELIEANSTLDNEIIIGELESNFLRLTLIVGASLISLGFIGGIAAFVVIKKRK